ncbi:TIGR02680 family protein [Streptomyces sp. NBC_01433]|uniref:TIGR02680 family protein n=1 Tax=Streptomyces sp. NBC_01433 TaxID=2903864 RepID=UPI0022508CA7|nr:TIGR02680 family protein [Streptomyces sp. NBC_01433]MCX4680151.1 TIGR02680 family protein [Streptomyces sp. NBC_01433]
MTHPALPLSAVETEAPGTRWQPARAGVLNVWRYYDEVFAFHRGRLLLRGPNGTGKSKALEVLLPFLFDASLRPHRLSTFGGSERTMHWNLMGEGATGVTRVGYVWLEFRTRGEAAGDGAEAFFTIGARLQASERTTTVTTDFFTTRRRVKSSGDEGFDVVDDAGRPLARAALAAALAGHGEVHASASEYRDTVRRTLFPGLSEQRYGALITALLQLRTPKLSQRLDPSLLSELLSRALPPLDQGEISELADGFERLDRRREHLSRLEEEVRAAQALGARQRSYAQRVLRSGAAALISATTDMDNHARAARESEEAHRDAVADRERVEIRQGETEALAAELAARIEVLTDSEAFRQGRELDRLRQRAAGAGRDAEDRRGAAGAARVAADRDGVLHAEAVEAADAQAEEVRVAGSDTWQVARRAGMTAACTEVGGALEAGDADRARQILHGAVRGRLGQVEEVRAALEALRAALGERTSAEELLESSRTALAAASERRTARTAQYDQAVEAQAERLRTWARSCAEIPFEGNAAQELAERATSEPEVLALVDAAARTVEYALTTAEATAGARRTAARAERDTLIAETEELERATELPPPSPPFRTADRSRLPGAPLWRLVAFHDEVPAGTRGAVEAALEASGLLDAWVAPYGGAFALGHDTFAEAEWAEPAAGRSLTEVLGPEPGAPVSAERIGQLLAGVAYDDTLPQGHTAAIGADGTWRLASATGSWSKAEAAYIGATARVRTRERRAAELAAAVARTDGVLATLDAGLAALADRREALEADRRGRPDHRAVVAAERDLDRARSDTDARDDAVRDAVARLTRYESLARTARHRLDGVAAEHGLPADAQALAVVAGMVQGLQDTGGRWLLAQVRLASERRTAAEVGARAERSGLAAREHEAAAHRAESDARALGAQLEEIEHTVGAEYGETLARIEQMRTGQRRAQAELREFTTSLRGLEGRVGSLSSERATAAAGRDAAAAARDMAADRFRHLLRLGFPVDAGTPDEARAAEAGSGAGTKATLETARTIGALWPSVPYGAKNLADALGRLAETVHASRQALGERADLAMEAYDDVQVLSAAMDGVRMGAAGLLDAVTAERDRSLDEITADERELFDRTLTGNTRRHLAARIRQANELVDAMNSRLERVRTASRVAVRLVWQVDPGLPPGTRAARDMLLKDPVRMPDSDREALHRFFRDRIEEAKASDTARNWEQQLTRVLDYTAWHQFVVKLDRANGQGWQLLTKKLHGALSGGEKAIALHLPLFAAVAAHYQAVPLAPRLILLDEVFVGVDSTNRGQVFDLLCSLDLDLMLTSDHEWCTYRELDGIAVHQLITGGGGPDDDAVTTARFVWNGADLVPAEDPPPTAGVVSRSGESGAESGGPGGADR